MRLLTGEARCQRTKHSMCPCVPGTSPQTTQNLIISRHLARWPSWLWRQVKATLTSKFLVEQSAWVRVPLSSRISFLCFAHIYVLPLFLSEVALLGREGRFGAHTRWARLPRILCLCFRVTLLWPCWSFW